MLLGAQPPVSRQRARLIDLNLVPAEYRRPQLSLVTVGLGLLLIGSLLLLYAVFYARTYRTEEVAALASRVAQGQGVVQTGANPTAIAQRQQLKSMAGDFQALKQRQINWGDVVQVIGDDPKGIVVKSVAQAGFGVTVTGSAADPSAAARYLQQLKDSGLFVNASLQVNPSSNPAQFASPTPPPLPTPPGPPTPGVPGVAPVHSVTPVPTQPASQPVSPSQPVYQPPSSSQPPVYQPPTSGKSNQPVYVPPAVPTATAAKKPSATTVAATPTITTSPTKSATPTPAFDFIVVSKQQLPAANPNAGVTDIQGKIVDASGNLVPGFQVEIDSELGGDWSAQSLPNKEDGTFDFAVTHGKFKVFVIGGSSQQATDLYTGADGTPGAYGYQIVFQKTFSGTTPVDAGTGTPTFTPTPTASPTVTPIALGANVANLGCASAYEVVNGVAKTLPSGNNPNLATDGNLGTEWNAGVAPSSGTQIIWQWSLPEPGQPNPCNSPGVSDTADQISAFELIADQSPAGPTTHELWLFGDENCQTNLNTSNQPWITWQQSTSAGSVLPLTTSNIPVRCVIVRTLQDPSYVAWEEVQIYQAVAPPNGFPTATATPTVVGPTATSTATGPTPTDTATATVALSPTATPSPTPTIQQLPLYIYAGQDVSPYASRVTDLNGLSVTCQPSPTPTGSGADNPCAAVDGNSQTYWAPPGSLTSPAGLTVYLGSSEYSTSDTITDVKIQVKAGSSGSDTYQVDLAGTPGTPQTPVACSPTPPTGGYQDGAILDCPVPTPAAGISTVSVLAYSNGSTPDGTDGFREVGVYRYYTGQPPYTPTATSPAAATSTASPTIPGRVPANTLTGTPNSTPIAAASVTSTFSPTDTVTPTITSAPTNTMTATATQSTGEGTSDIVISRQSAQVFGLSVPFGLGRGPGADLVPPAAPSVAGGYPQPAGPAAMQSVPTAVTTPVVIPPGATLPGQPGAAVPNTPAPGPAGAFPTPLAQDTSGPVDFTIVLELAPGRGYP